jgi:hypothetical protein
VERNVVDEQVRGDQRFFFQSAPNYSCSVTSFQNRLIFARVENFIHAFSAAIEHPQPRRSGTVYCVRNGHAFARPPAFLGIEHLAMRDISKLALQKPQRRTECI